MSRSKKRGGKSDGQVPFYKSEDLSLLSGIDQPSADSQRSERQAVDQAKTPSSSDKGRDAEFEFSQPFVGKQSTPTPSVDSIWHQPGTVGNLFSQVIPSGKKPSPEEKPRRETQSPSGGSQTPRSGHQTPRSATGSPSPGNDTMSTTGFSPEQVVLIGKDLFGLKGETYVLLNDSEKMKYFSDLAERRHESDSETFSTRSESTPNNNERGFREKGDRKKKDKPKKLVNLSELTPVVDVPKEKILGEKVIVPYNRAELPTFMTDQFTKKFKNFYGNIDTNNGLEIAVTRSLGTPVIHDRPFEDDMGL